MSTHPWPTPDDLAALRDLGRQRRFVAGSYLFHEGDRPESVLVVDAGTVKVCSASVDGHELVLALAEADDVLGEVSAMDGAARSAAAVALSDVCVHTIPTASFHRYLADHPRALFELASLLASRLRQSNRRQLEYANVDALGRLCSRLDELRARQDVAMGRGAVIRLPMTQSDLAGWAGLSREAVVKGLRTLRTLGWIETDRNTVTIHDPARLQERGRL